MAGADQEKRKQALDHFMEHSVEPLSKRLEKQLADNDSGYLIGHHVSIPTLSTGTTYCARSPTALRRPMRLAGLLIGPCSFMFAVSFALTILTAALFLRFHVPHFRTMADERGRLGRVLHVRLCQVSRCEM